MIPKEHPEPCLFIKLDNSPIASFPIAKQVIFCGKTFFFQESLKLCRMGSCSEDALCAPSRTGFAALLYIPACHSCLAVPLATNICHLIRIANKHHLNL